MGLISYTSISKKSCAILNDSHISHTISDRELFALVSIAHGLYDENCVCDTNYPIRLTTGNRLLLTKFKIYNFIYNV
jgi:hypothetical protein